MKNSLSAGFTFVELLLVMSIMGILAVVILVMLQPRESQKKARDVQRIRDLNVLNTMMFQFVQDNATTTLLPTVCNGTVWNSTNDPDSDGNVVETDGGGWIPLAVSRYIFKLPLDPLNNQNADCAGTGDATQSCAGAASQLMVYKVACTSNGDYEINVRQESDANIERVDGDSGNSQNWAEIFSRANDLLGSNSDN